MPTIARYFSLYTDDINIANGLIMDDLRRMARWSKVWKLNFKASKSVEIIFRSPRQNVRNHPVLWLNNEAIPRNSSHKHLGVTLDCHLNFKSHIDKIILKCNNMLNPLKSLVSKLNSKHIERIFMSYILPHLEYGSLLFGSASQQDLDRLDRVYYRAGLTVSGCIHGSNTQKVIKCLGWMSLANRRNEKLSLLVFDSLRNSLPHYLQQAINVYKNPIQDARLRNQRHFRLPANMSQNMRHSPIPWAIITWDLLPPAIQNIISRNSFKYNLRSYYRGRKNALASTKLNLTRVEEIYLNRSRCDLVFRSHMHAHNFTTVRNPACECGNRAQTTKHVLLHCPILNDPRRQLFHNLNLISNFENTFRGMDSDSKISTLLFGDPRFTHQSNVSIVTGTANFISSVFT